MSEARRVRGGPAPAPSRPIGMRPLGIARAALAVGVAVVLMGHSPYRQWAVYRETHLVVVADEAAPGAFAVSDAIARVLAAHVPKSRAVAASARSAGDVVKLLRTGQLPLGLLIAGDAADALLARGAFSRDLPLALRALAAPGPYLLVSLEEFPAGKAREIAAALARYPPEGVPALATVPPPVPLHPAVAGSGAPDPASGGG